jgi:tetratricopeptide (TPR) repeat protein
MECKARALEAAGQFGKAAKLCERLGHKDRALQLYKKAGDQTAIDRFNIERADVRQSQLANVTDLLKRGNYRAALQLAGRRNKVVQQRLGSVTWSFTDPQLLDESNALHDLIIECKARLAEEAKSWTKAAGYWRRIYNDERADLAQDKAIEALADPIAKGYALLRRGDYERAIGVFESAGHPKGVVQVKALLCQNRKEWEQAADLWRSIGDTAHHAAAMAEVARSGQDWEEAARWHRLAGQRSLAAEAERTARAKIRAEADRIQREQATLF